MKSLLASAILLAAAGISFAAVEVVPTRIEEFRAVQLVNDKVSRSAPSLRITLALEGADAADARKYGDVKIEEATDDQGDNIVPDKNQFEVESKDDAKFKEFSNAHFRKGDIGRKRPARSPQIEFPLKSPPKRHAAKIASLKGSVKIATAGEIKTVETAGDLTPGDKRELQIPENAGLSITLKTNADKDVKQINIEMSGDDSALESIDVIDAGGQKISQMSTWSSGGKTERALSLETPLDNTMKIVAKVAVDRTVTEVPFHLKDVPLP